MGNYHKAASLVKLKEQELAKQSDGSTSTGCVYSTPPLRDAISRPGTRYETIGVLRGCFSKKNGTPRQPMLAPSSIGQIEITFFDNAHHSVEGLSEFSHVWLIWIFHENNTKHIHAKVQLITEHTSRHVPLVKAQLFAGTLTVPCTAACYWRLPWDRSTRRGLTAQAWVCSQHARRTDRILSGSRLRSSSAWRGRSCMSQVGQPIRPRPCRQVCGRDRPD